MKSLIQTYKLKKQRHFCHSQRNTYIVEGLLLDVVIHGHYGAEVHRAH